MRFSDTEISHLTIAWLMVSSAFTIVWRDLGLALWLIFLIAALTVGVAFLLHEIAHKYMAQRFGCWAEFRSYPMGLLAAVAMAFVGFIFVAPGAVMISGLVTTEENGKISAAGPIVNIGLAILSFAVYQLLQFVPVGAVSEEILVLALVSTQIAFSINSWLAFFNLIPFGPLDGAKVLNWSRGMWLILVAISGGLTFFVR